MINFDALANLFENAQTVRDSLCDLRSTLTDEEWEKLEESPAGKLLNACADLEYTLEVLE
jgi:hypothetical protein